MNVPLLSIVSPVYKAERIVPELVRRIVESVKKVTEDYEIVLVCDGSPDNSWLVIKEECGKHVYWHYITCWLIFWESIICKVLPPPCFPFGLWVVC